MGRNNHRRRGNGPRPGPHLAAPRSVGIDIGRVLISPGDGRADTSFLSGSEADAMRTPPSPGAFDVVTALVTHFRGRAWLVSKCGPRIQERSRRWLAHHRFFERTGMPPSQLRFCRKRGDKAPICAQLGLDAFIDDRPDVLRPMEGIVPWRFLFGPQKRPGVPQGIIAVRDWDDVATELLPLAREQELMPPETPRTVAAPSR
ncbi:MAG: hypothetical protein AAF799_26655 [Myxococcota bacterium]